MTVLFLLALLLAWPTFGLSLVAYVVFLVFRGYLKAKTRMHNANVSNAERSIVSGSRVWPSWTSNDAQAHIFMETIQKTAMHQGVPRSFLQGILAETGNTQGLYFFAGALEQDGASFLEQQVACSDKLLEMWDSTSQQGKRAIMAKGEIAASKHVSQKLASNDFDDEIPF